MKYIKNTILILSLLFFSVGCDEDNLNLTPQDELSEATTFSTYGTVKIYAWGFYDYFRSYNQNIPAGDLDGDLLHHGGNTTGRNYIWGRVNVPSQDGVWNGAYQNIRRVNLMLDNIVNSNMTEDEITHWRGVGLFFRAHEYFRLLERFGGVPWLEVTVKDTDLDILYGPRDTRDLVATNILDDLIEAVQSIKETGDGPNTVNADAARALLSRFGLFEGTWRKYHNLGDHDKYLTASLAASQNLIGKYSLNTSYDQVFNNDDLGKADGIILYKHYVIDILTHNASTNSRSTNTKYDLSRDAVDMFLFKDGKSIWDTSSPHYVADNHKKTNEEFKNRDTRLLIITPPPYKVNGDGSVDKWTHTGNPLDQEWFPLLEAVTGGFPYKELPDANWSGRATGGVPNFTGLAPTQTGSGYRLWKVWNNHNHKVSSRDINDFPIFRIGEVMLNYAEVAFELGQFNQTVANATINKLRERGGVAAYDLGIAVIDPNKDPAIDADLWEIRRERGIELLGDGYRANDLRRWKKMDYATKVQLGRWIKQSDYSKNIPIQNNAAEGYVQLVPGQAPAFQDYYYLYPLPSDELVLNPQLEQNPGW